MFSPLKHYISGVWTRDIFKNVFEKQIEPTSPEECINMSLYFEAKTFLHGLLIVEDKLSMAHGMETRVPFLDNDLVDFAMRLPVRMKLRDLGTAALRINENETGKQKSHFLKTNDGKAILRTTMQRYIPDSITSALKQGFSAPDATWFKGDSMDYVRRKICIDSARIYEYFDKSTVINNLKLHFEGKENKRLFIWSLLSFENWLKTFLP